MHLPRLAVLERIGERLLDHQKDVVPHLGRQQARGQVLRQIKAATGGVTLEQLGSEVRNILDQALQRITARPQGPDDFLQRPHRLAGGLGDLLRVSLDLPRVVTVRPGQVAQQRDAGERGAQIVVQVLRNARPLVLQGALLFQQLQPALVLALLDQADRPPDQRQQPQRRQTDEPPRLPKTRQHDQHPAGSSFAPSAAAAARDDVEAVSARRQVVVGGDPLRAGLHPL